MPINPATLLSKKPLMRFFMQVIKFGLSVGKRCVTKARASVLSDEGGAGEASSDESCSGVDGCSRLLVISCMRDDPPAGSEMDPA